MGALSGIRVVELAGLAPVPFGCMLLADLGADVVRVERGAAGTRGLSAPAGPLDRGRRRVAVDLKDPEQLDELRELVRHADVFVEGFRPGVAERLGVGPEDLGADNPGLVYARLTGWGRTGPLAARAGHDINYIALAGALEPIGRAGERPVPPLNLLADFAGGGMLMALGILAALQERHRSGLGQVVDTAMIDGSGLLMSFLYGLRDQGLWPGERGDNTLDGGAPFYDTYRTADGRYLAIGCVEFEFWLELLDTLGIPEPEELPFQHDRRAWPELRAMIAERIATRTRDEWEAVFADSDACVTPVLSPWEAPEHPHHRERESFVEVAGVTQPAPAPRLGRTPNASPREATDVELGPLRAEWAGRGASP